MELTAPQKALLVQYLDSLSHGGVIAGKKPDPRVIRSLAARSLIEETSPGRHTITTLGMEQVRGMKTRDFRASVRPPITGSVVEGITRILTPRPSEKWLLDVAALADQDLVTFRRAEDKLQKASSYYSYVARTGAIYKYVVSSGRTTITIIQLKKFFTNLEPKNL